MGDREHGAKGLCQERAYVSGLETGNALLRTGALQPSTAVAARGGGSDGGGGEEFRSSSLLDLMPRVPSYREHKVLPIRPDEPQVVAGKAAAKALAPLTSFMRR